jgi:hypothetical protein
VQGQAVQGQGEGRTPVSAFTTRCTHPLSHAAFGTRTLSALHPRAGEPLCKCVLPTLPRTAETRSRPRPARASVLLLAACVVPGGARCSPPGPGSHPPRTRHFPTTTHSDPSLRRILPVCAKCAQAPLAHCRNCRNCRNRRNWRKWRIRLAPTCIWCICSTMRVRAVRPLAYWPIGPLAHFGARESPACP